MKVSISLNSICFGTTTIIQGVDFVLHSRPTDHLDCEVGKRWIFTTEIAEVAEQNAW